jgi:solute carrier family 35 (UDP-galactose transporter), member B1
VLKVSPLLTYTTTLDLSMGVTTHEDDSNEKHAGYWWLLFCVVGMVSSLTLYGLVLEFVTSGGRKLHEISFVFVTTAIYSVTAFIAREIFNEKPTHISKYQMFLLSITSIASTFTSVRSLRYVIYPVQVNRVIPKHVSLLLLFLL